MIKVRKFNKSNTIEAASLMVSVYKEFNKNESTKEGLQKFIKDLHPDFNTKEELFKKINKPIFFVTMDDNKIVGIVRGIPDRLTSLFVKGTYHKQGIGKVLVSVFEKEAKKLLSTQIKVRASLYAVSFYQRLGYKKTTGLRRFHGMKMYPMKKILL